MADPLKTLHSRYLFESPWRSFRLDRLDIGNGCEIDYTYSETPDAVFLVPMTSDGRIVLIREYRYPVRQWVIGVPAGNLDRPDEDHAEAARRELREEVGGSFTELIYLASAYASAGHLTQQSHFYLATGVELAGEGGEEALIQTLVLPAQEALTLARRGGVKESQGAHALLLAEPYILKNLERNHKQNPDI